MCILEIGLRGHVGKTNTAGKNDLSSKLRSQGFVIFVLLELLYTCKNSTNYRCNKIFFT